MPAAMTDMQKRFAVEYASNGGNATAAAKSAGYSEKSAHEIGRQLLGKQHVLDLIRGQLMELRAKSGAIGLHALIELCQSPETPGGARVAAARALCEHAGLLGQCQGRGRRPCGEGFRTDRPGERQRSPGRFRTSPGAEGGLAAMISPVEVPLRGSEGLAELPRSELEKIVENGTGIKTPAPGSSDAVWTEWFVATILVIAASSIPDRKDAIEHARELILGMADAQRYLPTLERAIGKAELAP